ncbi:MULTISPECIES: ribosome biogenesis factor YjgA [unclassified Hahella]|uniref:ribosome biogenesis factor YjgA n=1 Tax=unclassified Hahella TaxID=2624107 RepID=UPI001C1EFF9E|nr:MULTISPECIES: ribosome biogenesis factor YjgA [unclassified Hahella]MBU6950001.1 DUF615 domain-containing protein [Hahella sp. HN01]MDG9668206.1 DUF615 domain-containing protein [Hahella sp. CR1]
MNHSHHDDDFEDDYYDEEDLPPSKSSRKRAMEALQQLGKRLTELKADQLSQLSLTDRLLDAIHTYNKIGSHEAKRRQLQFIGKLMRDVDEEELRSFLDKFDQGSVQQAAEHHRLERWRESLISEGDQAVTEFMNQYPNTEAQHLRQLIRAAQKDITENKNRGAAKKLYRYLKEVVDDA